MLLKNKTRIYAAPAVKGLNKKPCVSVFSAPLTQISGIQSVEMAISTNEMSYYHWKCEHIFRFLFLKFLYLKTFNCSANTAHVECALFLLSLYVIIWRLKIDVNRRSTQWKNLNIYNGRVPITGIQMNQKELSSKTFMTISNLRKTFSLHSLDTKKSAL